MVRLKTEDKVPEAVATDEMIKDAYSMTQSLLQLLWEFLGIQDGEIAKTHTFLLEISVSESGK